MIKYLYIFSLLFGLFACNQQEEKIYPQRRQLVESVYASVTVQPDSLYEVFSSVVGIVDQYYVEEGDTVDRGDRILHIVNTRFSLSEENAALELELAKENYSGDAAVLEGILDEIRSARIQLHNDSINFIRQQRLWHQNIGSKIEFDNRKMAYELAENQVALLEKRYYRTKQELETKVNQAENNYQATATVSDDYTIKSKINGMVYAVYKNPGELVNTLEPVASIGHVEDFILELIIDEVDIVKLQPGQKIVVTLDAYENAVFEAVLTKIFPQKEIQNQTFKAEATFVFAPPKLYAGLAGEGNIVIASKTMALLLPKAYVLPGPRVLTDTGEVDISTGLESLEYVEILSGIDEHTAVLKPEL